MRNLIQIVSLFFILVGIVALVAVIPPLIDRAGNFPDFATGIGVVIAALTPGGAIIVFGSVSYMLCSIDMRLEEMLDRPQPRPVQIAQTPMSGPATAQGGSDHDLF
jgi:hypothetical protein